MKTNLNRRGRTGRGSYAYRSLVQLEEKDYHPDSTYWRMFAQGALNKLKELWPDGWEEWKDDFLNKNEKATWKDLCLAAEEKAKEFE